MTQSHGEMRETYPGIGESFRYRLDEQDGRITFELEGDGSEGIGSAMELAIETRDSGEGLCRTASGATHTFAWAWVGPELHLWLDGALYIFQRPESRRRGSSHAADQTGDILAPMPGTVLGGTGRRRGQRGAKPDGHRDGVHEDGAAESPPPATAPYAECLCSRDSRSNAACAS